jgi:hypothetical protein
MEPRIWIEKLTFSDGTIVNLTRDDIIVIVGPNNSGKSEALRGIKEKFTDLRSFNPVIAHLSLAREGTPEDLSAWLEGSTKKVVHSNQDLSYSAHGTNIRAQRATDLWLNTSDPLAELSRFFCHLLTADERLQVAKPPNNIAIVQDAPVHPIHYLQRDDQLELDLSKQFRLAFGEDLIVHRNAGNTVPVHVGLRPKPKRGEDRVSLSYNQKVEQLPQLQTQGDGMKSFAGVLLSTSVGRHTTLLIDEPEAFLHPPQARHLGRMVVSEKPSGRQLFIATHSGDVVRGILDSDKSGVRVIRLRRSKDVNVARELDSERIAELWSDPLLRYSNILDGLFHEKVVLCESDADCRFYAAVMDVLHESTGTLERKRDCMFTHCGGKARLPLVIRSLKEVDVPLAVVTDFDVLSEEYPLRAIVEASRGVWSEFSQDWRAVKRSVDGKKPELTTSDVKTEIDKILSAISDTAFPLAARKQIEKLLRRTSPWSIAKSLGKAYVPNGQPSQACNRLLTALKAIGVFVVPVGELECFAKTVDLHGPSWVNGVLKKNLRDDAELQEAREFVSEIVSS